MSNTLKPWLFLAPCQQNCWTGCADRLLQLAVKHLSTLHRVRTM